MAKIHLSKNHGLDKKDALARVYPLVQALADKYAASCVWRDDVAEISVKGLKGKISIDEHCIQIRAELGMMMSMMKGTLEQELMRMLDKHFD